MALNKCVATRIQVSVSDQGYQKDACKLYYKQLGGKANQDTRPNNIARTDVAAVSEVTQKQVVLGGRWVFK